MTLYLDFIVKSVYFSGGEINCYFSGSWGRNSTAVLNSVTDDDAVVYSRRNKETRGSYVICDKYKNKLIKKKHILWQHIGAVVSAVTS